MGQSKIGTMLYAVGLTDTGRVRPANEDAFVIADMSAGSDAGGPRFEVGNRGVLLAVSDGMGGAEAGEVASALVVESLRDHLDDSCKASDILVSIRCAVEAANRDVAIASREAGRAGMGATLVAVLVHRALAHIAAVGDSRVYLIRSGQIHQLTRDQSYVEMLIEAGIISREQAEGSPHKNVILQAMGQRPDVTVALARLAMRRGDVFVLCSDGLSNKVTADEMRRVIEEGPSHEAACARLVALANERGGEDNITVVVGEVSGLGLEKPASSETVSSTLEAVQEFDPAKAVKLS